MENQNVTSHRGVKIGQKNVTYYLNGPLSYVTFRNNSKHPKVLRFFKCPSAPTTSTTTKKKVEHSISNSNYLVLL